MSNIYFTKETTKNLDSPDSEDEQLTAATNIEILKYIEKSITELSLEALSQIYKIIKEENEKYTIKKDVILINLGQLDPKTIQRIIFFLRYLLRSNKLLMQDEITKETYRKPMQYDAAAMQPATMKPKR